jgi:hypothetical protein
LIRLQPVEQRHHRAAYVRHKPSSDLADVLELPALIASDDKRIERIADFGVTTDNKFL